MKEISVDAKIENLDNVLGFIDEELEKVNCPIKIMTVIDIAVDELFTNIANYAYKDKVGYASIVFEYDEKLKDVIITFIDTGIPYNPLEKKDPDVKAKLEDRGIGGLGIYMVKKSMDAMAYEYKKGKNILKIKKNIEDK